MEKCVPTMCSANSLHRRFLAEMIGVFIIVFVGCGALAVNVNLHNTLTDVGVCAILGFSVVAAIYATYHVSGGHLNPAVSMSLAAINCFSWKEVPVYVVGQIIGAVFGSGAVRLIFGKFANAIVSHHPGSTLQALALEIILTFVLMFTVAAIFDPRSLAGNLSGMIIATTITGNELLAGKVSGISMNPARSIGAAIVANEYHQLWVYLLGPVIGGVLGAFTYNLIKLPVVNELKLSQAEIL